MQDNSVLIALANNEGGLMGLSAPSVKEMLSDDKPLE